MIYENEEFSDELPDLKKWEEREHQLKQQSDQQNQAEPSVWRLVGLVEGKQLPMEHVEAYASNDEAAMKQAIYKLCFSLNKRTKTGKHPLKMGWGKIYASLKKFVSTNKKVDFWIVKTNNNEEEEEMDNKQDKKNNNVMVNNQKGETKMNEKKNIEKIIAKANETAKETVAQKAVKEQPVNEARTAYEAELAAKDKMVVVDVVGKATIQNNNFEVRILKDEKKAHSYVIVNENGVKVAMFVWGKALLPNITVLRNDEYEIDYMKMFPYQKGEDLVVDPDYANLAVVIFGSMETFMAQLRAEQNRRAD